MRFGNVMVTATAEELAMRGYASPEAALADGWTAHTLPDGGVLYTLMPSGGYGPAPDGPAPGAPPPSLNPVARTGPSADQMLRWKFYAGTAVLAVVGAAIGSQYDKRHPIRGAAVGGAVGVGVPVLLAVVVLSRMGHS